MLRAHLCGISLGHSAGVAQHRDRAVSRVSVPPNGVSASRGAPTSSKEITVSWTVVPDASYLVLQSMVPASTCFTQAATGVTTTCWTSGSLKTCQNYWYEVVAQIGVN